MLPIPAHVYRVLQSIPAVPSTIPIYKSTQTDTANANASTFSAVDIGTPHAKRIVILAVFHGVAAACTATINGRNCDIVIQNTSHEVSILSCEVPVGLTADIVVTATTSIRKAVSVYVAYPKNHQPIDSGTATANVGTAAVVSDMKCPAGGFLIYVGAQLATLGTFTTTWNGAGAESVVEDVDAQLEAASSYSTGHINMLRSDDLGDVTFTQSTSGTKRLAVATWGPS